MPKTYYGDHLEIDWTEGELERLREIKDMDPEKRADRFPPRRHLRLTPDEKLVVEWLKRIWGGYREQ